MTISEKTILEANSVPVVDDKGRKTKTIRNKEVVGSRIYSNLFMRLVLSEAQYVLANGVTFSDPATKKRLGVSFDRVLEQIGTDALVKGVCWGYWNAGHLEMIPAATDAGSGFVALVDEMTSTARVGIQFWQIDGNRPMYIRLFEQDGVTMYAVDKDGKLTEREAKRAYIQTVITDAAGSTVVNGENYTSLPVKPLWANNSRVSELKPSIRTKIDAYDRILSDLDDNLAKSNDVYWVLNNFGGSKADIVEMLTNIKAIKAIANISDGTTSSTVEPHRFEVPYEARKAALELLEKAITKDFMGVDGASITGGSLTNVAIKAAMTDMDMKSNAFEWQCFSFVQAICELAGIQTEEITFKRRSMQNDSETIANIYMMREDLDRETALRLNPMISDEDIDRIIGNLDAETISGLSSVDSLQKAIGDAGGGA